MAKEVVTSCDKCGMAGNDVRTWTIRTDGNTWEVDLDDEHSAPLLELAQLGRVVDAGRGTESTRSLVRRIRGIAPQE